MIIDFGGVLSTPFDDSARAFCLREGLEPDALRTTLQANAQLVQDVESGKATQQGFNNVIAAAESPC
ncbi:hypothetical protein ACIA8G_29555 [Lentzea sp. NPDC051213]|uniref:hypothetical protein n=1 Tax=Lentzea sp. NPDC051213 TaxID=3364126 RepID=UPI0037906A7D